MINKYHTRNIPPVYWDERYKYKWNVPKPNALDKSHIVLKDKYKKDDYSTNNK